MTAHSLWIQVVCDDCGAVFDHRVVDARKGDARQLAHEVGWHTGGHTGGNRDLCPACWDGGVRWTVPRERY